MVKRPDTEAQRKRRHRRVRGKIEGTASRPRLNVYRSLNHIYAQIIDDGTGTTLCAASSLDKEFKGKNGGNKEGAREVGKLLAKRAVKKGCKNVVFDRGGYLYHGRVKELAEGAREAGLEF
ncbi:MAG: 50S ribosomal protein L18 [Oscillospiraceae bacterium]|nr:50S ribosomal protein L18 [Oscillospiraceae bacterium]